MSFEQWHKTVHAHGLRVSSVGQLGKGLRAKHTVNSPDVLLHEAESDAFNHKINLCLCLFVY